MVWLVYTSYTKRLSCLNSTPHTILIHHLSRYKEEPDYNYFKGRGKKKTKAFKHFTQVVWCDTKKVGVGIASKFLQQNYGINYYITYVVARYFDRGNVEDKFIINVMPLKPESKFILISRIVYNDLILLNINGLYISIPRDLTRYSSITKHSNHYQQ